MFNIIAFKVFQAISEFVRGNMEPYHWKLDRIMLHGISKQQNKKCFLFVWIIFLSSEIIAISISIALYGRSSNKHSNLNELKFDVKFCETEAEDFQVTFSSYWPNAGVGILKHF